MGKLRQKVQSATQRKDWCGCDSYCSTADGRKCIVCGRRMGRYRLPIRDMKRLMND